MFIKYIAFQKASIKFSEGHKILITIPQKNEYVRLTDGKIFKDKILNCDLLNNHDDLYMKWRTYTGIAHTSEIEIIDFFTKDRDVYTFDRIIHGLEI